MADVKAMYRGLLAVVLVAGLSACGAGIPQMTYDVDVTGCGKAQVRRMPTSDSTVLDVVVDELPGVADPTSRIARVIWRGLSSSIDLMRVRSVGSSSSPVVLTRAQLDHRYGPINPDRDTTDELLWMTLLLVPVTAAGAIVLLARIGRRTGLILIVAGQPVVGEAHPPQPCGRPGVRPPNSPRTGRLSRASAAVEIQPVELPRLLGTIPVPAHRPPCPQLPERERRHRGG